MLSRPIKVHTPAGKVRVVALPPPQRRSVPFEEFEDNGEVQPAEEDQLHGARSSSGLREGDISPEDALAARLRAEYQAGFDEGRRYTEKTSRAEYERRLAETENRLAQVTADLARQLDAFRAAAERDIVRLAIAIAERVVKREIRLDDEFVVRQIQEAMKRVIGVERVRIRMNPQDEEIVRRRRSELLTSADAVRELTIEADETIPRGSCVLESDGGNVDASVQTQLERIEAALLKDLETK